MLTIIIDSTLILKL